MFDEDLHADPDEDETLQELGPLAGDPADGRTEFGPEDRHGEARHADDRGRDEDARPDDAEAQPDGQGVDARGQGQDDEPPPPRTGRRRA
jgi:hypothetical protein